MTTKNQLLEAVAKKGYQFDVTKGEYLELVGFTTGNGVWHWWKCYDGVDVFYDHSYSQNCGRSYKSFLKGYNMEIRLGLR